MSSIGNSPPANPKAYTPPSVIVSQAVQDLSRVTADATVSAGDITDSVKAPVASALAEAQANDYTGADNHAIRAGLKQAFDSAGLNTRVTAAVDAILAPPPSANGTFAAPAAGSAGAGARLIKYISDHDIGEPSRNPGAYKGAIATEVRDAGSVDAVKAQIASAAAASRAAGEPAHLTYQNWANMGLDGFTS